MKGKTFQKELYKAATLRINLHHFSVLLKINSFHWLLLYLSVTIREKLSAATMTDIEPGVKLGGTQGILPILPAASAVVRLN